MLYGVFTKLRFPAAARPKVLRVYDLNTMPTTMARTSETQMETSFVSLAMPPSREHTAWITCKVRPNWSTGTSRFVNNGSLVFFLVNGIRIH